jgi:hypothetical protein
MASGSDINDGRDPVGDNVGAGLSLGRCDSCIGCCVRFGWNIAHGLGLAWSLAWSLG